MKSLAAAVALVLPLTLAPLLLGCNQLFDQNQADASCEGGPTLGAQCTSVYTTLCEQAGRCNTSASSDCAQANVTAHCPCAVEDCDASSCETATMVAGCQSDLSTEDCNAIVNFASPGYWPSSCTPFMTNGGM